MGRGWGGSSVRTTQLCPFVLSPWGPQSPGEDTSPAVLMHGGGLTRSRRDAGVLGGSYPARRLVVVASPRGAGGDCRGSLTYTGRESAVNPYPLRDVSGSPYPAPGGSTRVVLRPGRNGEGGVPIPGGAVPSPVAPHPCRLPALQRRQHRSRLRAPELPGLGFVLGSCNPNPFLCVPRLFPGRIPQHPAPRRAPPEHPTHGASWSRSKPVLEHPGPGGSRSRRIPVRKHPTHKASRSRRIPVPEHPSSEVSKPGPPRS